MLSLQVQQGKPLPYGATVFQNGVNFSIFSKGAKRVVLHLFEEVGSSKPCRSIELDSTKNKIGDVWSIFVPGLKEGTLYLYQIDGEYNPPSGNRFNFEKFLFDPYAKAFSQGSVFLHYEKKYKSDVSKNSTESDLSDFPKCVVVNDEFDWQEDKPLCTPLADSIIYEMHVKGFTANHNSNVSHPGTYIGITEKIDYLKSLGITAVELLPIFEFDENEVSRINPRTGKRLSNFWGYSTIGFFAPAVKYSAYKNPGGCVNEFKTMVRELHKAGIEVILDVVFNHTAEGNEKGHTFCFRGIENSVYYMLPPERQYYMNYSGCGNTINANHPIVKDFILSALRYWVLEMHVDGFRFDLASALTRDKYGNVLENAPLIDAISEDAILQNTKIIAEPWDCGGAYHVGNFGGSRWCEWNGRFRDDMRRFIRGDEGSATKAATRISGNSDLYKNTKCSPLASINFITCHDGFTMYDLVSYNGKHNEENGEDNRDGSDDNLSYNNGFEGESTNKKIVQTRIRKIENFFLSLFISQGVPMILSGDEVMRTQNGNNNAYCQDNETSYFDWDFVTKNSNMLYFVKTLIALRKKHKVFRQENFFDGSEIVWYNSRAKAPDWNVQNRFIAFKLIGSTRDWEKPFPANPFAAKSFATNNFATNDFYVAFNTDIYDVTLLLPTPSQNQKWFRIVDTSIADTLISDEKSKDALSCKKNDKKNCDKNSESICICSEGNEKEISGLNYVLPADSAVLFISK